MVTTLSFFPAFGLRRNGNGCVMSIIQPRPWSHSIHTTV
jgi:hypothetical protein